MTYNEVISRFEVFDNPPKKDGYDRHHVIPESEQVKMYGSVIDNRQIYLTWPQHFWVHLLYDREHGTKTALMFLQLCGKPAEFFTCYELCLAYTYTFRKKMEIAYQKSSESLKGREITDDWRHKISETLKGKYCGEKSPLYRKPKSEEHRRRLSESLKGKYCGEKSPCYGKQHSEERKRKNSESHKGLFAGKKNPMYGTVSPVRGKHWYHNESESIMAYECPEGFVLGRLSNKRPSLHE